MLGLQTASQTPQNMIRTGQCVLNLASPKQADAVNRLARLTGTAAIPALKQRLGYTYEPSKFEVAGLTPIASQTVAAPRALECPIQLEAVVAARHGIMDDDPQVAGLISAFEVRITRVHVHPSLLMDGHENRIDPAKWQPLIMNFQKLYGVSSTEIVPSRLAEIEETSYRMPDVDRAREAATRPSL
jgi:flavin reductase (DIM6/NTAB) family NADH-FMN oxidoreductase RutF